MQPLQLAVLGNPISHSKSPLIHRAAYRELGLDWRYRAIRCGEAPLAAFLAGRGPEWRGFSLTMPLKDEAFRLATTLDPIAQLSGVVNTLHRLPEGGWAGYNTDVAGLAAAIQNAGLDATRTLVLGAGATAVSAVLAARSLGAERVEVVARRADALTELVARFVGVTRAAGPELLPVAGTPLAHAAEGLRLLSDMGQAPTLIISTLPGPAGAQIELPAQLLGTPLFDVAYDPWPSPLAERWRAEGTPAHSGIDMLVEQALMQVRIFTAGDPEAPLPSEARVLEAMRAAAA